MTEPPPERALRQIDSPISDSPLPYQSKQEYAYATIRSAIMEMRLAPGARLSIRELASTIGVSPLPVREALRRLSVEGFVISAAHRGIYVTELSAAEMKDLYGTRLLLEPRAAELSVLHITNDQLKYAGEVLEQMEYLYKHNPSDTTINATLNRRFHMSIYAGYPFPVLLPMIERLYDGIARYQATQVDPHYASDAMTEHRQILEAAKLRDVSTARELTRTHIEHAHFILADRRQRNADKEAQNENPQEMAK